MSTFPDRIPNVDSNAAADVNLLAQGLPEWLTSRTYVKNTFIWHGDPAVVYRSLEASNQGNTPASSPTKWGIFSGGINALSFPAGAWDYPPANPAPLDTDDAGGSGTIKRHLFDDTTEEFIVNQFVLPSTLNSGTVTFEAYGYAVTAAASKNIKIEFNHSAKTGGETWSATYASITSGNLATDSTQDQLDRFTFTETIANLGWTANDQVRIKLSRIAPSVNTLVGDWGLTHFRILLP